MISGDSLRWSVAQHLGKLPKVKMPSSEQSPLYKHRVTSLWLTRNDAECLIIFYLRKWLFKIALDCCVSGYALNAVNWSTISLNDEFGKDKLIVIHFLSTIHDSNCWWCDLHSVDFLSKKNLMIHGHIFTISFAGISNLVLLPNEFPILLKTNGNLLMIPSNTK
jgi:hypothetical protein